jgi:hypothetical protein
VYRVLRFPRSLSLCAYPILIFALASHARAQSPIEDLLKAQQPWKIQCYAKGCIASVDILRGYSHDPPDPKDVNQYISIATAIDYATQKPSLVMFEVDLHADQQAGIDLFFAHTSQNGNSWKSAPDDQAAIHLPFKRCDNSTCKAIIGGGSPDAPTLKSCADLIARMQSEDHLFLSYSRNGHFYQTAISLSVFKEAYQRLLTSVASPPASPANP